MIFMTRVALIKIRTRIHSKLRLLISLVLILCPFASAFSADPVRIGVLAFRPKPQTLQQWQPLAVALKQAIPDRDFVIEAYTYPEMEKATTGNNLDFVLTNPGHYVLLATRIGLTAPLATLAMNDHGQPNTAFGGVIFTRAEQPDVQTLSDIRGKTVAATGTESLGGYQMQAYELSVKGIRFPDDAHLITTGMPHDNVVKAVLSGRADVGFVRTGVLEHMVSEGKLDIAKIKVINLQNTSGFPQQVSTRLYPEWPFASLPSTDENLARHVAATLFMMEENTVATRAMGIHGFVVPADYTPVADLLKELRMPPFDMAPKFDILDVWHRYFWQLISSLLALGLISILGLRLMLTSRNLKLQHNLTLQQKQLLQERELYLSTIIQNEPECIKIIDRQGHLLQMNPAGLAMIEADSFDQVAECKVIDLIAPEFRDDFINLHKLVISGTSLQMQYEVMGLKGGRRWLETHAVPMQHKGQTVHLGVTRDITEKKMAEEKLQLAASVFSHAREGIMITSIDGEIIDVNASFSDITGYGREEVLGCNPRILSSGRQSHEYYANMWTSLLNKGHWYGEIWNKRKNGEVYAEMMAVQSVCDIQGNPHHFVALFSDITAHKEHEQQLEHIAHYDALTSLPNRILLADRLHQAISQVIRRKQLLAVVYIDLDGFKAINDSYGHESGDQLLMTVSVRMKQAIREGDTLARLGGDEFVAVLTDLPDHESAVLMLSRLLEAAAQPVHLNGVQLKVSASLGVTFYPQVEDMDADQLLRQADQAMYQAKLAGKNRYYVFDPEQDRNIRGHHESLERIRQALNDHEFVLYYQPKVNMRTGQVVGAEALIRWQHPKKGILPPGVFLPVIEDHPISTEIDEWVIDTALSQISHWHAAGLEISVSVNVSARELQQLDFVDRLREIISRHPDVQTSSLELEVLETSALEDMAHMSQVIKSCSEIGVRFALDDFGTGYSSLTYLKRLPVSTLKIDQSFVRDMLDDPEDMAILEGVIGLASAFQREVVAEGVETTAHGAMLLKLGCDIAQGYGIARPMPASEFPAWTRQWKADSTWQNQPAISRDDLPMLFAGVEHRAWIIGLKDHLKGKRNIPPPIDHKQCRFGRWLLDDGWTRHGTNALFQEIQIRHEKIHLFANEMLALHEQGCTADALSNLDELYQLRDSLLDLLDSLLKR